MQFDFDVIKKLPVLEGDNDSIKRDDRESVDDNVKIADPIRKTFLKMMTNFPCVTLTANHNYYVKFGRLLQQIGWLLQLLRSCQFSRAFQEELSPVTYSLSSIDGVR